MHILGDRFQVLLVSINGTQRLLDHLSTAAYDGPGPSEMHHVFPRVNNKSDGLQMELQTNEDLEVD